MNNRLKFDIQAFLKSITSYFVLSTLWTLIAHATDEFTITDRGLITGFGYLTILAFSIWFGKGEMTFKKFALLWIGTVSIFLIGSFVIGFLMAKFSETMWPYALTNSLFVSLTYAWLLNKLYGLEKIWQTALVTCLLLLEFYSIMDATNTYFIHLFNLAPRLTTFYFFQGLLILSLSAGLAIKRQ